MANRFHRKVLIYRNKLYKITRGALKGDTYCDVCSFMQDGYCHLQKHCSLIIGEYYEEIPITTQNILIYHKGGV